MFNNTQRSLYFARVMDSQSNVFLSFHNSREQRSQNQTMGLVMSSSQFRFIFLFLWKSFISTLIWYQSKSFCVGFFPSMNGVCRFNIETCHYQHQRGYASYLDLSYLRKGDPFWIWDPGICACVLYSWGMELWMLGFDYSRTMILFDTFGFRDMFTGYKTKESTLTGDDVDGYFLKSTIYPLLEKLWGSSLTQENFIYVFGPRRKRCSQRVSLPTTFWFGSAIWVFDIGIGKIRVNKEAQDKLMLVWDIFERKTRSVFLRKTLIRTNWYQIVDCSELSTKAMGFVIRCAFWYFYKEKLDKHNFRIRRLITKEENNGFIWLLASKALKKASSNSLFVFTIFSIWRIFLLM